MSTLRDAMHKIDDEAARAALKDAINARVEDSEASLSLIKKSIDRDEVARDEIRESYSRQVEQAVSQAIIDPRDHTIAVLRGALNYLAYEYEFGGRRMVPVISRRIGEVLASTNYTISDDLTFRNAFPIDQTEVMRLLGE